MLEACARAIDFYRLNAIFSLFLLYFVCHFVNIKLHKTIQLELE